MKPPKQCWCGADHLRHRYRRVVRINSSTHGPVRVALCDKGHKYALTCFGLGKNFEVRNRVFGLRTFAKASAMAPTFSDLKLPRW